MARRRLLHRHSVDFRYFLPGRILWMWCNGGGREERTPILPPPPPLWKHSDHVVLSCCRPGRKHKYYFIDGSRWCCEFSSEVAFFISLCKRTRGKFIKQKERNGEEEKKKKLCFIFSLVRRHVCFPLLKVMVAVSTLSFTLAVTIKGSVAGGNASWSVCAWRPLCVWFSFSWHSRVTFDP